MECNPIRLFVPSAAPTDAKLHGFQLAKTRYYLLQQAPGDFRCDVTKKELHIYSSPTTSQLYINPIDISVVRWVIDPVTTAKDGHDGSGHSSETGGISTTSDEMDRLGSLPDLRACLPFAALAFRKERYSIFSILKKSTLQPKQVELLTIACRSYHLLMRRPTSNLEADSEFEEGLDKFSIQMD